VRVVESAWAWRIELPAEPVEPGFHRMGTRTVDGPSEGAQLVALVVGKLARERLGREREPPVAGVEALEHLHVPRIAMQPGSHRLGGTISAPTPDTAAEHAGAPGVPP
jgi:hypothetical protein